MCSPVPALSQAEGNADEVSARDLEEFLQPFGNGRVVLKKVCPNASWCAPVK